METMQAANPVRDAFKFTVDKLPLGGPDNLRTPHYGLFRSDTMACVGKAVSNVYEPHTTDDVCALYDAACGAFGGNCHARCYFWDGHYVTVEPSREHRAAIFGTRHAIWPRLIIRAGYDGRAFWASLGFFNDLCANMSIIRAAGRSCQQSIRHTGGLRGKMEELTAQFSRLAGGWDSVVDTARRMESRQVNLAAFLRNVYPLADDATDRTRENALARIESIVRRVVRERELTGRPQLASAINSIEVTGWEAYNGVQGYVQHDQRRVGKPDEFRRVLLALEDDAVVRAEELALAV